MLIDLERVEAASPRVVRNDFGSVVRDQTGDIIIDNDRFQNRIMDSISLHALNNDRRCRTSLQYGERVRLKVEKE